MIVDNAVPPVPSESCRVINVMGAASAGIKYFKLADGSARQTGNEGQGLGEGANRPAQPQPQPQPQAQAQVPPPPPPAGSPKRTSNVPVAHRWRALPPDSQYFLQKIVERKVLLISPALVNRISELFKLLDTDNNGCLEKKDFESLIPLCNNYLQKIWTHLLENFDFDRNKKIKKDEFLGWFVIQGFFEANLPDISTLDCLGNQFLQWIENVGRAISEKLSKYEAALGAYVLETTNTIEPIDFLKHQPKNKKRPAEEVVTSLSSDDKLFVQNILNETIDFIPSEDHEKILTLFKKLDKDNNECLQADDFVSDNRFAHETLQKIWQKILHCCDFNDDKRVEPHEFLAHFVMETLIDQPGRSIPADHGKKQLMVWSDIFVIRLRENITHFEEELRKA